MNMHKIHRFFLILFVLSACTSQNVNQNIDSNIRCPSQISNSVFIQLVPQEIYGDKVLDLLDRNKTNGIYILQFNFFTDNKEDSYPKKIAQKLINIKKMHPDALITIGLEGQKDADDPNGKGAAQRNAKTKKLLGQNGIAVSSTQGLAKNQQNPIGREDGVSHVKLIVAGDEIIAGSSNLTKQSTDPGANNEMNFMVKSQKIADGLKIYSNKIISNPGQMVDMEIQDGSVKLLTDRLHFNELITEIRKAEKGDQIGLSMYQFLYRTEKDQQAKQVYEELVSASQRGVNIRIYLNRADDLETQNTAANLRVAELLENEKIHKIYLDPVEKISHSKYFFRISANEKVALVSSVNIYAGDFNNNHQLTWSVKNDPVIDQLATYFDQQIAYDGVLLSRIPKDPKTGSRYTNNPPNKMKWNEPIQPERMLRFWRGFKQDGVNNSTFQSKVNSVLIPETIYVGSEKGLMSYLPSFFSENKPEFIPDEIAIIDYQNEETYNAIRSTTRGKKYGPLHFEKDLFTKKNSQGYSSSSLVASRYMGKIEITAEGKAYYIDSENQCDWKKGKTSRTTILLNESVTSAKLERLVDEVLNNNKTIGFNGMAIAVDTKYVILMLNTDEKSDPAIFNKFLSDLELKTYDQITLKKIPPTDSNLKHNEGASIQFESRIKPQNEIISNVINELYPNQGTGSLLINRKIKCENVFN